MKAYIIIRGFEVGDPYEQEWVTDIVGCTLSKTRAEDWCARAVKQAIYFDSQFDITEVELDKLPELLKENEVSPYKTEEDK